MCVFSQSTNSTEYEIYTYSCPSLSLLCANIFTRACKSWRSSNTYEFRSDKREFCLFLFSFNGRNVYSNGPYLHFSGCEHLKLNNRENVVLMKVIS